MAPDQRFVVMMPSAQRGWIAWRDGKPAHVICGLYSRSFDPGPRPDGYLPFTSLVCRCDGGSEVTFLSSSWGGRSAFEDLVPRYLQRDQSGLPIVRLGSKQKLDRYGLRLAPVFPIVDWLAKAPKQISRHQLVSLASKLEQGSHMRVSR